MRHLRNFDFKPFTIHVAEAQRRLANGESRLYLMNTSGNMHITSISTPTASDTTSGIVVPHQMVPWPAHLRVSAKRVLDAEDLIKYVGAGVLCIFDADWVEGTLFRMYPRVKDFVETILRESMPQQQVRPRSEESRAAAMEPRVRTILAGLINSTGSHSAAEAVALRSLKMIEDLDVKLLTLILREIQASGNHYPNLDGWVKGEIASSGGFDGMNLSSLPSPRITQFEDPPLPPPGVEQAAILRPPTSLDPGRLGKDEPVNAPDRKKSTKKKKTKKTAPVAKKLLAELQSRK